MLRGRACSPSSGVVATIHGATVRDSFDTTWELHPPPDPEAERMPGDPAPWSLFRVIRLCTRSMPSGTWPWAPPAGPLLHDVEIGVDDDANLAWAVELTADDVTLVKDGGRAPATAQGSAAVSQSFEYQPSTRLPMNWHPYRRIESEGRARPWVQGLVAKLNELLPAPRHGRASLLIGGPSEPGGFGQGHEVDGLAIPSSGVRIQRRTRLARDSDGRPALWSERSAVPSLGPPASQLRCDVSEEDRPR